MGHHGTLFGETFHVLSLFREIAFWDEQGEVGILHTGCFEARIECLLDAFPDGIAVRLDHHTSAHRRLFGEISFHDKFVVPARIVHAAFGEVFKFFGHYRWYVYILSCVEAAPCVGTMQQDSLRRQNTKTERMHRFILLKSRRPSLSRPPFALAFLPCRGGRQAARPPHLKKYTTFAHIAIPIPFAMSLIAQSSVVSRLRHMWSSGQLPHALLLAGPSGAGQMAVALDFARLLLCEKPEGSGEDARPCGTCPSCRMVERYAHPDLHFSFPVIRPKNASSTSQVVSDLWITEWRAMLTDGAYFDLDEWGQRMGIEKQQPCIYADESDELLRKVSIVSARGGYKVVIVWLPELMNVTCANKILKLLEEPPRQTVFLLCSDHPRTTAGHHHFAHSTGGVQTAHRGRNCRGADARTRSFGRRRRPYCSPRHGQLHPRTPPTHRRSR